MSYTRGCPRGDDCDLTVAYMAGYHKRDAEVEALRKENERLKAVLKSMDNTIVARSELFISDQECLYNLRDRIRRAALQGETE